MDYFARLIFCFLLSFFSVSSSAFVYSVSSHGVTGSGNTIAVAMGQWANAYNALNKPACYSGSSVVAVWQVSAGSVNHTARAFSIVITRTPFTNTQNICGSLSISDTVSFTFSGDNTCVNDDVFVEPSACGACPSGQSRDASGQCSASCPQSNQSRDESGACGCSSDFDAGGNMVAGDAYTGCKGGCTIVLQSGWYDQQANVTWGYSWKQNGLSCSVSDSEVIGSSDPRVTEASKCPVGKCPGTIGGQSVCVPCDSTRQQTESTSSESSSTTASGASSPSSSLTSGQTTTSKTSCSDGSCTTTETTKKTGPDGAVTESTSTKTEPQSDYCTDNPKADVCKNDEASSWGGSCSGGFTCDGDAVQCAQAQAAYDMACAVKTDPNSGVVQAGNSAAGGGDRPSDHPANNTDSVSFQLSSMLDSTPLFGSADDCPVDVAISVSGKQIVLPFASLCSYLRLLGAAFMAACYLAAGMIVFRG